MKMKQGNCFVFGFRETLLFSRIIKTTAALRWRVYCKRGTQAYFKSVRVCHHGFAFFAPETIPPETSPTQHKPEIPFFAVYAAAAAASSRWSIPIPQERCPGSSQNSVTIYCREDNYSSKCVRTTIDSINCHRRKKNYYRSHIPISPGGPRVCPINANRAHAEGRNECTESLPGASQGGLPGQVNGGMDAWDLKGVHHVQNWIIFRASGCWFVVAMLQHKHSTKQWWKELRGGGLAVFCQNYS